MDVQPQSENDELINKVRSSGNQFEQELGALVAEVAELRTMQTSNIQQLESLAKTLPAPQAELSLATRRMGERRTTLASMEQRVSSVEQTVSSVASLSRSLQSDIERVGPLVLAALSRRTHRKPGWKAKVKAIPVPVLEPHRNYNVVEVAAILGLKYDTALRRITTEMRFQDHGTRETRFKRPKRKLTVSGKDLAEYIRKHTVDESN